MPSSRLGPVSYSRSQSSRLCWTVISTPLWVGPGFVRDEPFPSTGQDLLGRRVGGPLLPQSRQEARIRVDEVPRLRPRPLPHEVRRLVPEALIGPPVRLPAGLRVPAV